MHRFLHSTTRNVRLSVMLVLRGTNRITRPVSETVAVKISCYELLLMSGPSFRSHLALSTGMSWTEKCVRRGRRERLVTAIPRGACLSHTWTLKVRADLQRPGRLTCLPALPPPRPVRPFRVRKQPSSQILPRTTLPPQSSRLLLHRVHPSHGLCSALSSRLEVCETDFWNDRSISAPLASDLESIVSADWLSCQGRAWSKPVEWQRNRIRLQRPLTHALVAPGSNRSSRRDASPCSWARHLALRPSCPAPLSRRHWPTRPWVVLGVAGASCKRTPGLVPSSWHLQTPWLARAISADVYTPAIIPSRVALSAPVERRIWSSSMVSAYFFAKPAKRDSNGASWEKSTSSFSVSR